MIKTFSMRTGRQTVSLSNGFTIIELLVVIVIIGILAAITIVSYTGISQRAAAATLQSDLKNAATQLGIDNVNDGSYPSSKEDANGGRGLPESPGTVYEYALTTEGYCLSASSTGVGETYHVVSGGAIETGGCTSSAWRQIGAGAYHACAVGSDNLVYCWGYAGEGSIGNNPTANSLVPVATDFTGDLNGLTIKSLSVGYRHTCVIASNDMAYCYGRNQQGPVGNNEWESARMLPDAVYTGGVLGGGKTIQSITSGSMNTCAIASDDKAYCWGGGWFGENGDGTTSEMHQPVAVSTAVALLGKTMVSVVPGTYHSCGLDSAGQAYCWGRNESGEIGDGTTTGSYVPVAVSYTGVLVGKTFESISAGDSFTCAIASDDKVYCWGHGGSGRLGNGATGNVLAPAAVDDSDVLSGLTIKSISAGSDHACVIASDDLAYCWGKNDNGQLGDGSTTTSLVPVAVDMSGDLSGKTIHSISASLTNTCVIASDNQAYCWGRNVEGALGNGTTDESHVPVATIPIP